MQKEVNKSEGGSLAATVWSELTVSWLRSLFFFFFSCSLFEMKPRTRTTFSSLWFQQVLLPPCCFTTQEWFLSCVRWRVWLLLCYRRNNSGSWFPLVVRQKGGLRSALLLWVERERRSSCATQTSRPLPRQHPSVAVATQRYHGNETQTWHIERPKFLEGVTVRSLSADGAAGTSVRV